MLFTSGSSERTLSRIAFSIRRRQLAEHLPRVVADRNALGADHDVESLTGELRSSHQRLIVAKSSLRHR